MGHSPRNPVLLAFSAVSCGIVNAGVNSVSFGRWLPIPGHKTKQDSDTILLLDFPLVEESVPFRPRRVLRARGGTDPYVRYAEAKRMLDEGACKSRADLARFIGVSRARITQLMMLDNIADDVWAWLKESEAKPLVSELALRRISRLARADQLTALKTWCPESRTILDSTL